MLSSRRLESPGKSKGILASSWSCNSLVSGPIIKYGSFKPSCTRNPLKPSLAGICAGENFLTVDASIALMVLYWVTWAGLLEGSCQTGSGRPEKIATETVSSSVVKKTIVKLVFIVNANQQTELSLHKSKHCLKLIRWFCSAYLLLRLARWPLWKRVSEVALLKWSWLKGNAIGILACGSFLPRWDSVCWECA